MKSKVAAAAILSLPSPRLFLSSPDTNEESADGAPELPSSDKRESLLTFPTSAVVSRLLLSLLLFSQFEGSITVSASLTGLLLLPVSSFFWSVSGTMSSLPCLCSLLLLKAGRGFGWRIGGGGAGG